MKGDRTTREILFPQGRLFYGWIVVAVCFVTVFVTYGIIYSFGVFFVAMFQEFQWSRGETAAAFSVNQLVYGIMAPFVGALLDRRGPRQLIPLGGGVMALGLLASSRIDSVWQFYLFYGVFFAIGVNLTGAMPNSVVVQLWFSRSRGAALGIALAGVGFGTALFVPLTQHLVSSFGWRVAYQILAAIVLMGIVPLTAMLHRKSPQSIGLAPDGLGAAGETSNKIEASRLVIDTAWAARRWNVGSALRTRRFWIIFVGIALQMVSTQTVLVHQVAFLGDSKIDPMAAAVSLGLVGLISAFCRPMWGIVSDRTGREHAFAISAVLSSAGVVVLMASSLINAPWLVAVYMLLFATGYAAAGATVTAICADIFEGPTFGAIFGVLYIATGIGGAFGPWFAGYTHDLTDTYYLGFSVAASASLVAALAMWLAAPRKIRMVAGKLGAAVR